MTEQKCDILIIGGGLAGLSLSILCAKKNYNVVVLEKGIYPKHKVCGEYISKESVDFLKEIDFDYKHYNLPEINTFKLTSEFNSHTQCKLTPGGIGISRYLLDFELMKIAQNIGVKVFENEKFTSYKKNESGFSVNSTNQIFKTSLLIDASGRKSSFNTNNDKENSYVGIKYHLSKGPKDNVIEIHHFKGGYAGISQIENNQFCLAYLVKSSVLKKYNNKIEEMEREILYKNNFLKERLSQPKIMGPITTSVHHFELSSYINQELILIGDAAGFIPPITGNGMSLAFRSAKQVYQSILKHQLNQNFILKDIQNYFKTYLKKRIYKGNFIQNLLTSNYIFIQKFIFNLLSIFPFLTKRISKLAVGKHI